MRKRQKRIIRDPETRQREVGVVNRCVCVQGPAGARREPSATFHANALGKSDLTVIWLPACSGGNQPFPQSSSTFEFVPEETSCKKKKERNKNDDALLHIETSSYNRPIQTVHRRRQRAELPALIIKCDYSKF